MPNSYEYIIYVRDKGTGNLKRIKRVGSDTYKKLTTDQSKLNERVARGAKQLKTLLVAYAGFSAVKGVATIGSEMEKTSLAFNTFLGSARKGQSVLANLNKFSNMTPFNNAEVIKSGRSLLAANVPASKLVNTLGMIGDVAAGANVPITDLSNIYAKAMNKGKLQAEELNQMAERGIPIIDELAKNFGVNKQKVFELGSQGKITSKEMVKAFQSMTAKGGKFNNLMQKQSKTTAGMWSTLLGKLELTAVALFNRVSPGAKKVIGFFTKLTDATRKLVEVPVERKLRDESMEATRLVAKLRFANLKEEERLEIIKKLNDISPTLTKNLDQENISIETLTNNLRQFNREQAKRLVLAGLEAKEAKLINKETKRRARIEELLYGKGRLTSSAVGTQALRIRDASESFLQARGFQKEEVIKTYDALMDAIQKEDTQLAKQLFKSNKSMFVQLSGQGFTESVRFTIRQLKNIKKEAGAQIDLAKRIKRLQQELGIEGDVNISGNKATMESLNESNKNIIQGGRRETNINVDINNLIETLSINKAGFKESIEEMERLVKETLLRTLNSANALAT